MKNRRNNLLRLPVVCVDESASGRAGRFAHEDTGREFWLSYRWLKIYDDGFYAPRHILVTLKLI